MLCDTQLCNVRILRILIVVILAVEEHNDVRVLLDGAGLTQIREHGALVRAALCCTRELGEHEDGHLQFTCENL